MMLVVFPKESPKLPPKNILSLRLGGSSQPPAPETGMIRQDRARLIKILLNIVRMVSNYQVQKYKISGIPVFCYFNPFNNSHQMNIIVTGASRGIGYRTAMKFALDKGNTVIALSRNVNRLKVLEQECLEADPGSGLVILPYDLENLEGIGAELRDRIKTAQVTVKIVDHTGRKELIVVPRQFTGRLLHNLKPAETVQGDIYLELYLSDPGTSNSVGLYRRGTRVLPTITELDHFNKEPWTAGYLQGIVDVPFLSITPGTRHGIIHDDRFDAFYRSMEPVESHLQQIIEDQRKAEEERSSRRILRRVQRALKEAFLRLPQEEYDWFDIYAGRPLKKPGSPGSSGPMGNSFREGKDHQRTNSEELLEPDDLDTGQKQFFEYAGPLFSALISPKSSVVSVDKRKKYRVVCRDRSRRIVLENLECQWNITDGEGQLDENHGESIVFIAPPEPCLTTLEVVVRQGDKTCRDEALITVTDSLMDQSSKNGKANKGLPGYTFRRAPGEMWRSRFDIEKNVIVINNGHRDFVYAGKQKSRKLRYICRLFCKELVRHNFPGLQADELLERMIELSLYTEEHLK